MHKPYCYHHFLEEKNQERFFGNLISLIFQKQISELTSSANPMLENTQKIGISLMDGPYSGVPNKRAACLFVSGEIFYPSRSY